MRSLILGLAVSLDGFIAGPNGEYDWCFNDQDYGMSDFFTRIDSTFIGRKTYEMMLDIGDTGGSFPRLKEYVFSNTLASVKEGTVLLKGDIKEKVEQIKREPGKDIWLFGGANLTTSLMNFGLVDELWLSVHPILLGSGKPLFENIQGRIILKLITSHVYDTGLVSLRYDVMDT